MAKKRRKRKGLSSFAEEYAIALLYESSNGKIGRVKNPSEPTGENPVSIRDRIKLLDSVTKLLGAQDTGEEEEEDGLSILQERLKDDGDSGTPERGAGDADEG